MRLKGLVIHGQYLHPHFRRWSSFVQRCYNPNSTHYKAYGGRGIGIEEIWAPVNPNGAANFLQWMDAEVAKFFLMYPEYKEKKIEVGRKDVTKDFGPNNCEVRLFGATTHYRRTATLDFDTVVSMRRHKRANPDVSLHEMEKLFHQTAATISRALRGVIWACCNSVEPPIPRYNGKLSEEVVAAE